MDKTLVVETWEDVEKLQKKHPPRGDDKGWIFRGQSKCKWTLKPSLLRLLEELDLNKDKDHAKALRLEALGVDAFQKAQPVVGACLGEWIFWWAVAQHYGGATRVLDWSGSLLVGLWFAVKEHFNEPGALYALDTSKREEPNGWPKRESDQCWERQHEILSCKDGGEIHYCTTNANMLRLRVQEGWFTTCTNIFLDHDCVIRKRWGQEVLVKYSIPQESKPKLLQELYSRGYSGQTLFADTPDRSGFLQKDLIAMNADKR